MGRITMWLLTTLILRQTNVFYNAVDQRSVTTRWSFKVALASITLLPSLMIANSTAIAIGSKMTTN